MKRPLRQDFQSRSEYESAREKFVEHVLGERARLGDQVSELKIGLEAALKRLANLESPAKAPPKTLEELVRERAHTLITDKYSATDQLNITRAAARLGATSKAHVELDRMDEWIDAVLLHCDMLLSELANLDEDGRKTFDVMKGWPREA